MISASSAFIAANNKLAKQPTWILEIEGYKRVFTNRAGLGSFQSLPSNPVVQQASQLIDFGGLSFVPGTATLPNATPAGNLIFAFLWWLGSTAPGISDTAGNTWTQIYHGSGGGGYETVWVTTSVATGPGNVVTWDPTNVAGNHHNSDFMLVEVPAAYSAYTYGSTSGTTPSGVPTTVSNTVGANTVSFQIGAVLGGESYFIFQLALAQATTTFAGINLLFVSFSPVSVPNTTVFVAGGSGGQVVLTVNGTSYDWLKSLDDLKITISDLAGGSDLSNLVFNVQDRGQQLTADMASFVFEGKNCNLLMGYVGMTPDQFVRLYTGVVDLVESDNENTEYKFTVASKNQKRLSSVVYTTGDSGFATDSKNPRSILGHPLDILVSVMQQANIPLTDIDTAKIYYYRDVIYSGLFYQFSLTTAPVARDFIQNELLKPMGMYLWENNLGTMSINSFYPAISGNGSYTPPTPPIATLDVNDICVVPVEKQADLIDQVTFRFDENGSSFDSETVASWQAAIAKYGLYGAQFIESKGMRSSFQGYFMAAEISHILFLRYGTKPIVLDPLTLFWRQCLLEPGDIIAITLAFVPDRTAGVMGVTTKAFEIMDRNWRFMSSAVELKLLEIDLSKFKQYLITPNAQPDYTADTAPNQAKYMYQSNAAGKYSNAAPGNTLG